MMKNLQTIRSGNKLSPINRLGEITLRACLNFAFEPTASKYCSERGRRREHSPSYVTDAQRSAEQYLPLVGRSVKFKQALIVSLLLIAFCVELPGKSSYNQEQFTLLPDTLPVSYHELFEEISDTIANHFYDPVFVAKTLPELTRRYRQKISMVKNRKTFDELIRSYLSELQTSHTSYHTPSDLTYYHLASIFEVLPQVKEVFDHQEIQYPSISILLKKAGGNVQVIGVLDGGPAATAGLRKGDVIQSIDDQAYNLAYLWKKIDQTITVQVLRGEQTLEMKLKPVLINPNKELEAATKESIRLIEKEGKTFGYIHLWSFAGRQYYDLLKETILYGELKDADGLILDIRDGWGGASPEYLNIFNQNIPSLTMIDQDQRVQPFETQWRRPVVLLINKGSRSGKEVLAYGFKKYKIGTVVGEKTAGAVTAGRLFFLADQSLMYLAVRGVKVDGEVLEGIGVMPVVKVEDKRDTIEDEQLEEALEVLLRQ